jgi:hypothetical protein
MLVALRFPEYWFFRTRASRAALTKAPQSIDSLSGAHRSGLVQGVSSYACSLVPTDSVVVKCAMGVVRPCHFCRARRNVWRQLDDPWRRIPDSTDRIPQPVERWPFADDRRSDPRHRGSTMTLASGALAAVSCPLCHVVAPPAIVEALAAGGDWRCPRCDQNWSAARLATVAAYANYCASRPR